MKQYLLAFIGLSCFQAISSPTVVSTIYPLQQIANAISGESTELIADTYLSPHSYRVTPSDAKKLLNADLVVSVGDTLMPQLNNYIQKRQAKPTIRAAKLANIDLIQGKAHNHADHHADHHEHSTSETHEHEHKYDHDKAKDQHTTQQTTQHKADLQYDPHLWLSPKNANVIATAIAKQLSAIDPEQAQKYQNNLKHFQSGLKDTTAAIKEKLNSVELVPYFVFHDAYHYFEDYFGVSSAGEIRAHANQSTRTKHLNKIKKHLDSLPMACLFKEPQFQTDIIETLGKSKHVVVASIDPVGYQKPAEGYFKILTNIADSMVLCSQGSAK